jgi:hypothetical protein
MRKKAGFEKQVFQSAEKLAIEMRDIIHKMRYEMPETFFGFNIFLPANMAEPSINGRAAV